MSFHIHLLMTASALALLALQHAAAQPIEVFTGYTVGQIKPGNDSNRNTMTGWNSSLTYYPRYRWGITTDFAGYYGTTSPTLVRAGNGSAVGLSPVSVRQHSFMVGPQVRFLRKPRFETSFRALFGVARGHIPAATYSVSNETTSAASVGNNFDITVNRKMAVRFSTGLYLTRFSGHSEKSLRFGIGPVFRLGGGEE
jgi:hypothetical protein